MDASHLFDELQQRFQQLRDARPEAGDARPRDKTKRRLAASRLLEILAQQEQTQLQFRHEDVRLGSGNRLELPGNIGHFHLCAGKRPPPKRGRQNIARTSRTQSGLI